MPTQLRIEHVESALIAALTLALVGVNVGALSEKDIDAQGNLIVTPPAALVMFDAEVLKSARDNTQTTYDSSQRHLIIVGTRNFGGESAERLSAKALASDVRDALAGRILTLEDGSQTAPICVAGVERFQFDNNGTWYSVAVDVEAIAQFTAKS